MPDLNIHMEQSLFYYGYDFKELHQWIDDPSKLYAGSHRVVRHDIDDIKLVLEIFKDKVPEKYRMFIRDAFLDHLILDRLTTKQNQKRKSNDIKDIEYVFQLMIKKHEYNIEKVLDTTEKYFDNFDREYDNKSEELMWKAIQAMLKVYVRSQYESINIIKVFLERLK